MADEWGVLAGPVVLQFVSQPALFPTRGLGHVFGRTAYPTPGHGLLPAAWRTPHAALVNAHVTPVSAGFSLAELLVSLAILAGLASLAGPGMVRLVQQERSTTALNQLLSAVHLARSSAITRGATVTLCPSVNGQTCAGRNRWHEGAIVFSDEDRDGRRDTEDALLRALPGFPDASRVYWRSFRNKSYLQINGRGMTNWQNGHFLYCPANRDPRLARQLILNAQARVRKAPDTDGDGIAEDARGKPIQCP